MNVRSRVARISREKLIGVALPAHSIEAEQSVLGGLMLNNGAYDRVADVLRADDFYRDDHRRIYCQVAALIDSGRPADAITIAEALEAAGELGNVGGLSYLGALAKNVPSAANIRRYAEIVRDRALLRGLGVIATDVQELCVTPGAHTPAEIAAQAESEMLRLLDRNTSEPQALYDVCRDALCYVDERASHGAGTAGIATGLRDFDRLTGGLEPGQLVIVAARPSVGKSALACNVADHASISGKGVLLFTLEMTAREIAMRILAARSGISIQAMRAGLHNADEIRSLSNETGRRREQRLFIDDRPAITTAYARTKARRMQRQLGLDLIIVDYLQLMRGQGDNRTQEIGSLSRGLKALAKELRVPVGGEFAV